MPRRARSPAPQSVLRTTTAAPLWQTAGRTAVDVGVLVLRNERHGLPTQGTPLGAWPATAHPRPADHLERKGA
ncbi:hypothetical protein JS756_15295 [Streptomyces actuosus]|uniref:Uncharacterized protein n=1 Tax=Streptomyces actuosus TaxID=1885 RepID=A0ABS2VQR7_STRAS|nr:hypothetical protein [Streptomyces actuosus]MBN0045452.1 hypothetical protein [Streptomyces actuosus]